jgi:ferredoxin
LLDLAEARGLTPDYSCRGGSCGTCAVKVLAGKVTYASRPSAKIAADHALICCAVPAAVAAGGGDRLILDL